MTDDWPSLTTKWCSGATAAAVAVWGRGVRRGRRGRRGRGWGEAAGPAGWLQRRRLLQQGLRGQPGGRRWQPLSERKPKI
jgi:hypothetical protein